MAFFSAILNKYTIKKTREVILNILRAQEDTRGRKEPGEAIETTRQGFFDNETIFVFITSRSRSNSTTLKIFHNALSLQANLARSAAHQSARTIVAI